LTSRDSAGPNSHRGASDAAAKLERLARRASWILLWERAWPPLAWSLSVVAGFLAASWFGVWFVAPRVVHFALLAIFALALLAALFPLGKLRWPSRGEALARLDRDARIAHRPASGFEDELANGERDETTKALWTLHRARLARQVEDLSLAPPSPRMAWRDPRALRFGALLLAVVAGLAAGPERYARLAAAFDSHGGGAGAAPPRIDAWIDPPTYTNKPPLLLRVVGQEKPESLVAPEDSVVVVRSDSKQIEAHGEGALAPSKPPAQAASETPSGPGSAPLEQKFVVKGDGKLNLTDGGAPLASFAISATALGTPKITLIDPPQANVSGSMTLHYSVADNYGIASAEALFARPNEAGAGPVHTLAEPPSLPLSLPNGRGGAGEARTTGDLSKHPWAGADVIMTLRVTSVAGKLGESAPFAMKLPQRNFTNPLARALVEQRRDLILDPDRNRPRIEKVVDALTIAPEVFETPVGVYLGLRTANALLKGAQNDKDLIEVADLFWAMALQLEDGDASQTLKDLRAVEKQLREALQRGASDEEIKALTKQLRDLAERYLNELAQQDKSASPDDMPMDAEDLDAMLDRMDQTARDGARDEAQAMLDQLQDMFENLKGARGAEADPAQRELNEQLNELQKLLRDQQALRDETFRRDRRERSRRESPDASAPPNDEDAQGKETTPLDKRQGDLRDRLAELQRRLKALGLEGKGFDDAQGAMSEAEGDLTGEGRRSPGTGESGAEGNGGESKNAGGLSDAVEAQGRALQALREGAQGLQQQLQGSGSKSGMRAVGRGEGRGQGRDPLGRGQGGTRGASEGVLNEGPEAAERARKVLQELRRRLADPNRSTDERDYIERLLGRE
jgi:uncharacterized protein (TIGR02302 family)